MKATKHTAHQTNVYQMEKEVQWEAELKQLMEQSTTTNKVTPQPLQQRAAGGRQQSAAVSVQTD